MTTPAEKLFGADRCSTAQSEEDIHAIEVLVKKDKQNALDAKDYRELQTSAHELLTSKFA
eukprot:15335204-Ditylum_brightwellii.AAC.1